MKVCVKGIKKNNYPPEVFNDFLNLLHSEMPLKNDLNIVLCPTREGKMTTGVRNSDEIRVLSGGRMLIDILRTLAHEWVHEYQHQQLGLEDSKDYPDIGGPVENMASALGSIFLKKFQKEFPKHDEQIYN